ncbi:23S ribosomal RNA methyltransferase Erm [Paenibacillus mendelii]|uniref:rRNA adenine N-6-methyltransferase n=1 Tax=Paenibacillus mendelii TaxID=206163 RepID=A0ABV6J9F5_9BACL|nr:23S ribosomal RNA methyltransferase Erm [Paenibacillus mendelii]MCQ6559851.1 23S ribosomal RNA methyltransferase Erm [Paenibacillus mendelii]
MSKNNIKNRGIAKIASNFSAQHLLINQRLIHDLIDLAEIKPKDTVLDIGAGTGAITFPLAARAANVTAIESDPAFAGKLLNKLNEATNIRVKQVDFLQYSLPKGPFTVVANIPYSITTPILRKLLDYPTVMLERAVLIVEKGAAQRFTVNSVTDPRILKWRMWYDIKLVRSVPPHHFSPPPRVESAVLTIRKKKKFTVPPHHHLRFMALAEHGLQYPQFPFYAALTDVFRSPQITKLVRMLRIDRNQPICSLTEQQWGELFLAMVQHVEPWRWPRISKKYIRKK